MSRHFRFFSSSLRLLPAVAIFLLPAAGAVRTAHAQEVLDGIAAVVNDEVITFSQVRDIVGAREKSARDTLKGQALVEKVKEIRLAALNELIDRQLILQEFKALKKKGAEIPPHVLDEHIETIIREQFGNDRSAFIRTLAAQGYTLERFRQIEEEKIIVQAMRGQQAKTSVIVPEQQIHQYYQENIESFSSEEQVKLRMLVLTKSAEGSDARKRMMEEIREKIVGGSAFQDLARMYSDANQEQGGDWGWIGRKTLNEQLTKIAFSMKPGEVSKIVEIENNYYLLYCEARKTRTVKPLSEVRDEIEKKLAQTQRQQQQAEWIAKLRKKAYVKIY